jgi:hypothetical protein
MIVDDTGGSIRAETCLGVIVSGDSERVVELVVAAEVLCSGADA